MLGPLLNQYHIRFQFENRCLRFIHAMKQCNNSIVQTIFECALQNANSPLGHNITFFRQTYNVDIFHHNLKICIEKSRPKDLDSSSESIVQSLRTLLLFRCNSVVIDGFKHNDITALINFTASN